MKLLLVSAIAEFGDDVKKILKKNDIKAYSYKDVKGFRDASEEVIESNWFGTEMHENNSVLFYVFTPASKIDNICEMIKEFNDKQEAISKIHLAVLNIEKTN